MTVVHHIQRGIVYYHFPFIEGLNLFEGYITLEGSDLMDQFNQSWNTGKYQGSSIGCIDKGLYITLFNGLIAFLEI